MKIKYIVQINFFVFAVLNGSIVSADTAQNVSSQRTHAKYTCMSEESARKTIATLFKDFPSKKSFLKFEILSASTKEVNREFGMRDNILLAPTLEAAQPYLHKPVKEQMVWLVDYLPTVSNYFDSPKKEKWLVEYRSAVDIDENGEIGQMYKQFPKGIECVTDIFVSSPNLACYKNQQLRIDIVFSSNDKNMLAVFENVALTPMPCK